VFLWNNCYFISCCASSFRHFKTQQTSPLCLRSCDKHLSCSFVGEMSFKLHCDVYWLMLIVHTRGSSKHSDTVWMLLCLYVILNTLLKNFDVQSKYNEQIHISKTLMMWSINCPPTSLACLHCSQDWNQSFTNFIPKEKNMLKIWNVCRRELIMELSNKPHFDRSKVLYLPTLKYRRYWCDMIELFKIIDNYDLTCSSFWLEDTTKTIGHKYKLVQDQLLRLKKI